MMIYIITTGGTIEGLEYENEENKPHDVNVNIMEFFKTANVSIEYSIHNAFCKDSRFITQEDRKILAEKIKSTKEKKILITHGTLTMVETAKYLGKLNLDKTVVLVGSFVLGSEKNTDAPFNLGYAVCALQNLGNGVFIAMNGNTFSWKNVDKNMDLNRFEDNVN